MTPFQIIGNIISGIGMVLFFLSSFMESKKKLLGMQTANHLINIVAEGFTAQYTGIVQEVVNIIRNILVIKNKNTKLVSILLVLISSIIGVGVNIIFNNNDIWGYLPIIATLQYSIIVLIPNVKLYYIKASMCFSCICWALYSYMYVNYVLVICNIIIFFSSLFTIIKYFTKKSNLEEENLCCGIGLVDKKKKTTIKK